MTTTTTFGGFPAGAGRRQVVPYELDARPLVIVVTEEEAWAIDALRQLP